MRCYGTGTERARPWRTLSGDDQLAPHGLDAITLSALATRLGGDASKHLTAAYVARRLIAADPTSVQFVIGPELGGWDRRRGMQREVVDRLAALDWPIPVVCVTLGGKYAPLRRKFRGSRELGSSEDCEP